MIKMVQAIREEEDDQYPLSLEQETESLINQVFKPLSHTPMNPEHTSSIKNRKKSFNQTATSAKRQYYNYQHFAGRGKRRVGNENLSHSFQQFLMRTQEGIKKRNNWLDKEKNKKEENLMKTFRNIPEILRGSREKLEPLYERCIALQKSKEKKLNDMRVDKEKAEIKQAESYSYHPKTNSKIQPRSFEEYLAEKEIWTKRRKEELSRRKVELDAKQLSECTFTPSCPIRCIKTVKKAKKGSGYAKTLQSLENSFQNSEEDASLWG